MRTNLQQRDGERSTFRGTFARFGTKPGWRREQPTVLLTDICTLDGSRICDHLWFSLTKAFAALDLQPGDTIQFAARVTPYRKGYQGRREDVFCPVTYDYKLSHPTKVQKCTPPDAVRLDTDAYRDTSVDS